MRTHRVGVLLWTTLAVLAPSGAEAQGYRLRLDSRVQGVSWRGVIPGSLARADAIEQPGGGFLTPDGHAALCGPERCTFFTPGPVLRGVPWVAHGDLSAWGFGVRGLSLRASARWATDLGDGTTWPGTEPTVELVEGYLEYGRESLTARAGRQFLTSRLGAYGLDGGRASVRDLLRGLEVTGYLGWGLARGVSLPVTDPALNPLQDFQPRDRQIVAGAEAALTSRVVDLRAEYRREVDPAVDYLVSERAAASLAVRPLPALGLSGGAEYDLSFGHIGSADFTVGWIGRGFTLGAGWRRYRPFFDLWTIWGAFSPVAHHTVHASGSVAPVRNLTVHTRAERYQFDDTGALTPSMAVEDRGWRVQTGAAWAPATRWSLEGGYHAEFGPGAASRGVDLRATWLPTSALWVSAHGARMRRPLELRYSDADLTVVGVDAEYRPSPRWRVGLQAASWREERTRPDASALDWNQVRLAARLTLLFGSNADRLPLPRAVRTAGGGAR